MSGHAETIRPMTPEEAKESISAWASATEQEFCVGTNESDRLYRELDAVLAVIDALLAERQQLREALEFYAQGRNLHESLRAERQRYREALERISEERETIVPGPNHDYESVPTRAAKIARAALAGEDTP